MGVLIVHDKTMRWPHAYADNSIPDLTDWHSEAYVCGDHPARYPVPSIRLCDYNNRSNNK